MKDIQYIENNILERLNAGQTVHQMFVIIIDVLGEAVNLLITKVFRKDDYAVKYAVEPLLKGKGPLSELSVQLKLIYALGIISRNEYEDCELLLAIQAELESDSYQYGFIDDEILGPISLLHDMVLPPSPPRQTKHSDEILLTMQQQRYQQMIRSGLVLAVTELVVRIRRKKTFKPLN
jgi:mannitol operon repressor